MNLNRMLVTVLMGLFFAVVVSSCATVPGEPLAAGGVRLLNMNIPDKEGIGEGWPFLVNIYFEAEGSPEIRTVCFFWSGDGPYCSKIENINYGSPGTIKVKLKHDRAGMHNLEAYVLYVQDGKTTPTNLVGSRIRIWPR